MFIAQVFTLYPDYFPGPLNKGLYGKAMEKKIWDLLMEYLLASTIGNRIQVDKNLLIALHFSKKTVIARTLSLLSDNSFRMGA